MSRRLSSGDPARSLGPPASLGAPPSPSRAIDSPYGRPLRDVYEAARPARYTIQVPSLSSLVLSGGFSLVLESIAASRDARRRHLRHTRFEALEVGAWHPHQAIITPMSTTARREGTARAARDPEHRIHEQAGDSPESIRSAHQRFEAAGITCTDVCFVGHGAPGGHAVSSGGAVIGLGSIAAAYAALSRSSSNTPIQVIELLGCFTAHGGRPEHPSMAEALSRSLPGVAIIGYPGLLSTLEQHFGITRSTPWAWRGKRSTAQVYWGGHRVSNSDARALLEVRRERTRVEAWLEARQSPGVDAVTPG